MCRVLRKKMETRKRKRDLKRDEFAEDMRYLQEHRAEIQEINEYAEAVRKVNGEIKKAYGRLPFFPLQEPQRMTPEQCRKAFQTIDALEGAGAIRPDHAVRMHEHLKAVRPDVQA